MVNYIERYYILKQISNCMHSYNFTTIPSAVPTPIPDLKYGLNKKWNSTATSINPNTLILEWFQVLISIKWFK